MTSNIKTIKFTSIVCSITFVITYLVCLNTSYGWFDKEWLSNSFLLTIMGGIFASSAVVLMCEIHNYIKNKTTMENQIWELLLLTHAKVIVVKHNLEKIINTPKQPVPIGIFDKISAEISNYLTALRSIDYITIKETSSQTVIRSFFSTGILKILLWVQRLNVLNYAVSISKLNNMSSIITGEYPEVAETIQILFAETTDVVTKIEGAMEAIDYSGRFAYKKAINKINEAYDNLTDFDFASFLSKNNL